MLSSRIAACLCALLTAAVPAAAQDVTEEIQGWTIISREQPDEDLSPLCILRSPPANGTYFQVANATGPSAGRSGSARFNFYVPATAAVTAAEVTALINGKAFKTAPVEVLPDGPRKALVATLSSDIESIIKPLVAGNALTLKAGDETFRFSLKGSSRALAAYEACLSKVRPERY